MAKTFIFCSKMIDFSELLSAHDMNLRSSLGAVFMMIILLSFYLTSYYHIILPVLLCYFSFEILSCSCRYILVLRQLQKFQLYISI